SVRTSTTSSPRTPCDLATRPTTSSIGRFSRLLVGVDDVDADTPAADARHQGAQRGRGAAATADHLAEVVGVHVHLDGPPAPAGDQLDADVTGVGDDAAHQVLDGIGDDGAHYSAASASVASAAASSFLAFFFGVTASATGSFSAAASAALNSSSLDGFAGLVLRVPSVPGRPLNFCQSPVISSRRCTGSVGWAPTLSQYCTRSESISMSEGSSFGWYLPMDSMARPSRRVRASATTTRYWGLRIL